MTSYVELMNSGPAMPPVPSLIPESLREPYDAAFRAVNAWHELKDEHEQLVVDDWAEHVERRIRAAAKRGEDTTASFDEARTKRARVLGELDSLRETAVKATTALKAAVRASAAEGGQLAAQALETRRHAYVQAHNDYLKATAEFRNAVDTREAWYVAGSDTPAGGQNLDLPSKQQRIVADTAVQQTKPGNTPVDVINKVSAMFHARGLLDPYGSGAQAPQRQPDPRGTGRKAVTRV